MSSSIKVHVHVKFKFRSPWSFSADFPKPKPKAPAAALLVGAAASSLELLIHYWLTICIAVDANSTLPLFDSKCHKEVVIEIHVEFILPLPTPKSIF